MKLNIILLSFAAVFALASCKKKGVCTCTEDGIEFKLYFEDATRAEKRAMKASCNGETKGKVVKITADGEEAPSEYIEQENEQMENCEWSKE